MNLKAIWRQSEIWKANSTAAAYVSALITVARLSAYICAASSLAASRLYSNFLFFSTLIASALACHLALTLMYLILV